MNRIPLTISIAFLPLALLACQPQPPTVGTVAAPALPSTPDPSAAPEPTATTPPAATTDPTAEAKPSAKIPIQLASWEEVEQAIAARQGKVVVIDVWSTYCVPCIKEFPNLVKLHRQYPDQVACMSLNCNYSGLAAEPPEAARPEVEQFLTKQGATFENFICTDPDEKLFAKLKLASIPMVRVYDRQGKLRTQFDNDKEEYGDEGFRYDQHIIPLVEQLLKE